jgi:hypothetical protein
MIEFFVLNKVLAREYYRLNTGFFLLVITLAFGFMSGVEHRALAEFFIASPLLLSVPVSVWAIYLIKIINFNRSQIDFPQNQFLHALTLRPRVYQIIPLFMTMLIQFLPAVLYGFFLMVMALKYSLNVQVAIIAEALFVLLTAGTISLLQQLNNTIREVKVGWIKRYLDHRFTRPVTQFYLEYLTRKDPALVFGTKVFSGLLIFAVTQLYSGESYDERLLAMGCALAFSANFMIITQVHHFENNVFALLRNLPLSTGKRLVTFILVFFIICLPETVILIKYFPEVVGWIQVPSVIFFGVSIGLLFYGLHFTEVIRHKNFERLIFGLVMGWILLTLFGVPVSILALVNSGVGIRVVKKYFYRFESVSTDG